MENIPLGFDKILSGEVQLTWAEIGAAFMDSGAEVQNLALGQN